MKDRGPVGNEGSMHNSCVKVLEAVRDEWRGVKHLGRTLFSKYPRELDREGTEILEQMSSMSEGVTPPEEIKEVRQRSRNWRKKVADFWIGEK